MTLREGNLFTLKVRLNLLWDCHCFIHIKSLSKFLKKFSQIFNYFRSQQSWAKANKEGWFIDEIEPVEVKAKKGTVMVLIFF